MAIGAAMRTPEELAALIDDAVAWALERVPRLLRESPDYRERLRRACAEALLERLRGTE